MFRSITILRNLGRCLPHFSNPVEFGKKQLKNIMFPVGGKLLINDSGSRVISVDKLSNGNFYQNTCLGSVAVYHAGLSNKLFGKNKFDTKVCHTNRASETKVSYAYRTPVTRVRIPAQAQGRKEKISSREIKRNSHGPVTQPGRVSGF